MRERVVHDVPDAEKTCPCCASPRVKIGEETSEQLDYRPAKLFVWELCSPGIRPRKWPQLRSNSQNDTMTTCRGTNMKIADYMNPTRFPLTTVAG
jgi:hypothetical protein